MTFKEIERILRKPLPMSARGGAAFWSNRTRGALQAKAWMNAGFHVVDLDLTDEVVIFGKPDIQYEVRKEGDTILWTGSMIRALRMHLDISQAELSDIIGVRQQTISEWENHVYLPTRSRSKHLNIVAERAGFFFIDRERSSSNE
jgi:hypothetical protein